jgi:hypothetical protein
MKPLKEYGHMKISINNIKRYNPSWIIESSNWQLSQIRQVCRDAAAATGFPELWRY